MDGNLAELIAAEMERLDIYASLEAPTSIVRGLCLDADGHWQQLRFTRGHVVRGFHFEVFPHLCPGKGCQVKAWLERPRSGNDAEPTIANNSKQSDL